MRMPIVKTSRSPHLVRHLKNYARAERAKTKSRQFTNVISLRQYVSPSVRVCGQCQCRAEVQIKGFAAGFPLRDFIQNQFARLLVKRFAVRANQVIQCCAKLPCANSHTGASGQICLRRPTYACCPKGKTILASHFC